MSPFAVLSEAIVSLATKRKRDNAVRTQYELKPFFGQRSASSMIVMRG
jgi:hypothetical protein